MEENETPIRRIEDADALVKRGLGHDVIVGVAVAATGSVIHPVASAVVDKVMNRPPKEEPPEVILPPGVTKAD